MTDAGVRIRAGARAEVVAEQNFRILRHEAETPMRGHDEDGTCCRLAALDGADQ